jgi:colanic acid/amylovoran biosynthesis protein
MKKYNILITNIYSWKNKGDATIVLAMIENLKKYININKLWLSTVDPNDFWKYWSDYSYYESLQNYIFKKSDNKYFQIIKVFFFLTRFFVWWISFRYLHINLIRILFSHTLQAKISSYEDYDIIVACGWWYTWTKSFFSIFSKVIFCLDFLIAHFFNKPVFLYSQSFGPVSYKIHGYVYWFLFKNIKLLECREKISYELARSFGINNTILTWDIAFCLGEWKNNRNISLWWSVNVWITARKWFKDKIKQDIYESELALFIDKLILDNWNIKIYFIPQVIYEDKWDNDLECYVSIYQKIRWKSNVETIKDDLSPHELKDILWQCNYFVWTRMHSNILALSAWIRTIAIAYEHKTNWIMMDLWLDKYCVNIEDVTSELLYGRFSALQNDQNYLNILNSSLVQYKERADSAWRHILQRLS